MPGFSPVAYRIAHLCHCLSTVWRGLRRTSSGLESFCFLPRALKSLSWDQHKASGLRRPPQTPHKPHTPLSIQQMLLPPLPLLQVATVMSECSPNAENLPLNWAQGVTTIQTISETDPQINRALYRETLYLCQHQCLLHDYSVSFYTLEKHKYPLQISLCLMWSNFKYFSPQIYKNNCDVAIKLAIKIDQKL